MFIELKMLIILAPSGLKCSVPTKHQPNRGRASMTMRCSQIRGPKMLTEPKLTVGLLHLLSPSYPFTLLIF